MGECDRFKPYISDYLENNLDPSTQQEFEKALKRSADLLILTNKVRNLKTHLGKLSHIKCSDDFSLTLRERIHTNPEPVINRQRVIRYSFAGTIVLVLAVAIISLSNMSDSTESPLPVQGTSDLQINEPNPVSNPVSGPNQNLFRDNSEVEIKTKMTQQVIEDSSGVKQLPDKRKDDPYMKRVDKKE